MSGGHFNYMNENLCRELFGYRIDIHYGKKLFEQSSVARKMNPLEDAEISELVYDVFCLLHSFDWHASGDTGEETYIEDADRFKQKWLKQAGMQRCKRQIDLQLTECRKDLYRIFGIEENE